MNELQRMKKILLYSKYKIIKLTHDFRLSYRTVETVPIRKGELVPFTLLVSLRVQKLYTIYLLCTVCDED